MAKFSLARMPYYIFVIAFCAVTAIVESFKNDNAVGIESILHLALMLFYAALACGAAWYLFTVRANLDDEVGIEAAGIPVSKGVFYIAILVGAVYRGMEGFVLNTYSTGGESFWGKIWAVAAIVLVIFTWANYKSFAARNPLPPSVAAARRRA
jgi:hypothetical protein